MLSPYHLLSCPGLSVDRVAIGALHCLGLGVAQEVCGNAMWEALAWLDWGSRLRSVRRATMWIRLQQHYEEQNTPQQFRYSHCH